MNISELKFPLDDNLTFVKEELHIFDEIFENAEEEQKNHSTTRKFFTILPHFHSQENNQTRVLEMSSYHIEKVDPLRVDCKYECLKNKILDILTVNSFRPFLQMHKLR